jgi:hypothetical protein
LVIIKDAPRRFKAELLNLIQQLRKSKQNNQRNDLSKACFCPKIKPAEKSAGFLQAITVRSGILP